VGRSGNSTAPCLPLILKFQGKFLPTASVARALGLLERSDMEAIHYKGFQIRAIPYRTSDSSAWRMKTSISRHMEEFRLAKSFYARNSFNTRDEALQHCLIFGMEIVDGEYPDCSW
jgi:hypothetical protein